jgi:hypothetical protein
MGRARAACTSTAAVPVAVPALTPATERAALLSVVLKINFPVINEFKFIHQVKLIKS